MAEVVVGAASAGKTCPYCRFPLKGGVRGEVCDSCGTVHHAECWVEGGGCAVFGCQGKAAPPDAATLPGLVAPQRIALEAPTREAPTRVSDVPYIPPPGQPRRSRKGLWAAALVGALAIAALAGVGIALALERSSSPPSGPTGASSPPPAQPTLSSQIAKIVNPLIAPQQQVTDLLSSVQATQASFAGLRSAATALDQAALRAQGAEETLAPTAASGARAKSALASALSLQAAYASSLSQLPSPTTVTPAQADRISTQAGNVDGAFNRDLLDDTGNPCCAHMPVSESSVQGLIAIAQAPPPPVVTTRNPTLQPFTGSFFSIAYPVDWYIDDAEQQKPGFVDTTIRDPSSPTTTYLRVDYTPHTPGTVRAAALGQEQAARGISGYQEIGFTPTTLAGYPAYLWEFIAPQDGVLEHKTDLFLIDGNQTGIAILMQAPVTTYASWKPVFDQMYTTFTLG